MKKLILLYILIPFLLLAGCSTVEKTRSVHKKNGIVYMGHTEGLAISEVVTIETKNKHKILFIDREITIIGAGVFSAFNWKDDIKFRVKPGIREIKIKGYNNTLKANLLKGKTYYIDSVSLKGKTFLSIHDKETGRRIPLIKN